MSPRPKNSAHTHRPSFPQWLGGGAEIRREIRGRLAVPPVCTSSQIWAPRLAADAQSLQFSRVFLRDSTSYRRTASCATAGYGFQATLPLCSGEAGRSLGTKSRFLRWERNSPALVEDSIKLNTSASDIPHNSFQLCHTGRRAQAPAAG